MYKRATYQATKRHEHPTRHGAWRRRSGKAVMKPHESSDLQINTESPRAFALQAASGDEPTEHLRISKVNGNEIARTSTHRLTSSSRASTNQIPGN